MPRPAMLIVSAENAPPEPWLLSTKGELQREELNRNAFSQAWLQAHPFPGQAAAKLPWLAALQKQYNAQLEEDWYCTDAPKAADLAQKVLMENAPEGQMFIELRVPRKHLVDLQEWNPTRFAVPERVDYTGEPTWKSYCQHLLQSSEDSDPLLAYLECSKDDETDDIVSAFLKSTGLDELKCACQLGDWDETWKASSDWGIQKLVGENLYRYENGKYVMPLTLRIWKQSEASVISRAFGKELKTIQEQMKAKGHEKAYLVVKKKELAVGSDDEEEEEKEEPMSADTHHVLWLPAQYEDQHERIRSHFRWGEGETSRIKMRLFKGNTDTGNLRVEMLEREFNHIKYHVTSVQDKFCAALSLVLVATDENYWMSDNEYSEELKDMVKNLASYFRTNLLKKSDRELGLGLGDLDKENSDNDMSESRTALYTILELRAKHFSSYDGPLKFNWKPGKPRKRRAKDDPNAAKAAPQAKKA